MSVSNSPVSFYLDCLFEQSNSSEEEGVTQQKVIPENKAQKESRRVGFSETTLITENVKRTIYRCQDGFKPSALSRQESHDGFSETGESIDEILNGIDMTVAPDSDDDDEENLMLAPSVSMTADEIKVRIAQLQQERSSISSQRTTILNGKDKHSFTEIQRLQQEITNRNAEIQKLRQQMAIAMRK
ncbi:hypothetical protein JQC92_21440 [Shewanella sp. 202IG2-18]|uniref:hypothetical protein n=1 Tax=Parashewanella hymeniacidonis TaxID=2807618 RepID=UPI001961BBEF|nr:hypothetical protein [Parashewanella hymeniacidonis]MBM7074548.1 hypothetical protein [Parashewanella hymeniacidonis]